MSYLPLQDSTSSTRSLPDSPDLAAASKRQCTHHEPSEELLATGSTTLPFVTASDLRHNVDLLAASSSSASSPCFLRSILSVCSSPFGGATPASSCALSRRSSTAGTSKSVRFARCTNASVFKTHSTEEYDRSPIIMPSESDSLEMPQRRKDETEGWIKCVARARAAAAEAGEHHAAPPVQQPAPSTSSEQPGALASGTSMTASRAVEGVNGLFERGSGYFVGDERTEMMMHDGDDYGSSDIAISDDEFDSMMVDGEGLQGLVQDDSSGDDDGHSSSDEYHSSTASTASRSSADDGSSPVTTPDEEAFSQLLDVSIVDQSISTIIAEGERFQRLPGRKPLVRLESQERSESGRSDSGRSESEDRSSVSPIEEDEDSQATARKKCKDRYGLCALGKYTRREVFESYDSLGGF